MWVGLCVRDSGLQKGWEWGPRAPGSLDPWRYQALPLAQPCPVRAPELEGTWRGHPVHSLPSSCSADSSVSWRAQESLLNLSFPFLLTYLLASLMVPQPRLQAEVGLDDHNTMTRQRSVGCSGTVRLYQS